jgi:hypothetical protein
MEVNSQLYAWSFISEDKAPDTLCIGGCVTSRAVFVPAGGVRGCCCFSFSALGMVIEVWDLEAQVLKNKLQFRISLKSMPLRPSNRLKRTRRLKFNCFSVESAKQKAL